VADSTGEVVSSATINAVATATHPQPGAQPDDPNDQGQIYNLNLLLPGPGHYSISTAYDASATIYRSNGGVTGYPFKIGDVFSITGNTATSGSDTAYYKNFYYYFYDITLSSPGCNSASRIAVPVDKPGITQNGTTLTSNFTTGNQWYLDGVAINGATNQNYSPVQSGNYRVDVTLGNGCIAQSDNFTYIINSPISGTDEIGLTLFPIPANGRLHVVFTAKAAAGMKMSLINSAGQTDYNIAQWIPAGNFSTVLDVSHVAPGNYVLKVLLDQKVYARKVVIDR
jgi:hypothetical protein